MKFSHFAAALIFMALAGCKSEDPNPELKDPIYLDLKKTHEESVKALEAERKSLEAAQKDLEKAEPRSRGKSVAQREIDKARMRITMLSQSVQYNEIQAERRRVEGRRDYRIAFSKGETWPNPKEFAEYQQMRRLKNAPKNWDLRVPKLSNRAAAPGGKPAAKKEEAAEAPAEH